MNLSPIGLRSGVVALVATGSVLAVVGWFVSNRDSAPSKPGSVREGSVAAETPAIKEQVATFCGHCHVTPPPDSFPRSAWNVEVAQGYGFYGSSGLTLAVPNQAEVVDYYETNAPDQWPRWTHPEGETPSPIAFERLPFGHPRSPVSPAASNIRFVNLSDNKTLDVLVCDMRHGLLISYQPARPDSAPRVLCDMLHNPAHAEVVDLDGDGRKDILVADLGSFGPSDKTLGSVVWLRGTADGGFTPMPLAWGLGRVADVQAADFDGDGDLDLIAAVFGWHAVGEVLYLENRTVDYAKPVFIPRRIDARHGSIHVPIADLNGDGRPDFVALLSQEHESIVAFLNQGGGKFTPQTLYRAPHPAFGSSGIELVDLDRDGDLDILYTNGDVLDGKPILRPDHGVRWLENRGGLIFTDHHLTSLPGASRAKAADMDGDGDLDIVATSFLPGDFYRPLRNGMGLDSLILLEQTLPGQFVRHPLETARNDHASLDLGDFDGDGKVDIATGLFESVAFDTATEPKRSDSRGEWMVLLRNLGRPR